MPCQRWSAPRSRCRHDFTPRYGVTQCRRRRYAASGALAVVLLLAGIGLASASATAGRGAASWYGEEHRGKLMANGKKFNPDKFTAASWHYPLGARVRVTVNSPSLPRRSVLVTITDRGPAPEFVREGRVIDLSHAPFKKLAHPAIGLIAVIVEPVR